MANFPGTFEIRLLYVGAEPAAVAAHELHLSFETNSTVDPGTPFTSIIPVEKSGNEVDSLDTHVDALVDVLQPLFPTTTDFNSAELWEYAPGTFDSIFRSGYVIGEVGTAGSAVINFSQTIFTFRSQLGGIMRVDLRGTIYGAIAKVAYVTAVTAWDNLMDYFIDPTCPWHARDGGYALLPLFALPGANERAFKKINR